MYYRQDLVTLITDGASEAEIVEFLIFHRSYTEREAYEIIEQEGIEFGAHRRYIERKPDNISPERRRYLQQLSLED